MSKEVIPISLDASSQPTGWKYQCVVGVYCFPLERAFSCSNFASKFVAPIFWVTFVRVMLYAISVSLLKFCTLCYKGTRRAKVCKIRFFVDLVLRERGRHKLTHNIPYELVNQSNDKK